MSQNNTPKQGTKHCCSSASSYRKNLLSVLGLGGCYYKNRPAATSVGSISTGILN